MQQAVIFNPFLTFSGDFFMNWISKWTGIFGIGLNVICLVYGGIYCIISNVDGQGLNPANDFRFCTALVVGTGDALYLNPANACTNNFLCPITLLVTQLGVNGYMKFIMAYLGVALAFYFCQTIFSWKIQKRLDYWHALPSDEQRILQNQIEQNVKDGIFWGTEEEHQDYMNNLNAGKGQSASLGIDNVVRDNGDAFTQNVSSIGGAAGKKIKRKKKKKRALSEWMKSKV